MSAPSTSDESLGTRALQTSTIVTRPEACWMMEQSPGPTLRKCTTPIPLALCDLDSQNSCNESAAVLCRRISYDNVLNNQTTNVSEYTAPFVELVHRKATQDNEE